MIEEENKTKKKSTNQSGNHLKALLKKNYILMKRNTCGTCCEIVLPIFFAMSLMLIRSVIDIEIVNQTSYIQSIGPPASLYKKQYWSTPPTQFDTTKTGSLAYTEHLRVAQMNMIKTCVTKGMTQKVALIQNGASDNSMLNTIGTELVSKFNLQTQTFNNPTEFTAYVQNVNYGMDLTRPAMCFGIQLDRDDATGFEYQLRFNITYRQRSSDLYQTSENREEPLIVSDTANLYKYQSKGFLAMQNWIDNLVLQKRAVNNPSNSYIKPTITSMQVKKHSIDRFSERAQQSTDFYLVLPLIAVFIGLVKKLLTEKELRIREGMKMMGMTNTSFYLSWFITYFLVLLFVVIVVSIIMVENILSSVTFEIFFFIYLMFAITLIFQAIFISVFFTRAKPGIVFAIVFFLLQYIFRSFMGSNPTETALQLVSLSPHTAFTLAINTMLSFQFNLQKIDFSNYDTKIANYSVKTAYDYMAVNMFFWMFVSLYLDQVFPNEFGQKKHPLFFLECLWKKKQRVQEQDYQEEENEELKDNIEEVAAQLLDMEQVNISHLTKVYESGKKAVDNLSLNMYLNQIFVLLGHNGAGKTSTISILTGLLNYTAGKADIFGYDISTHMESIRQLMGVCPQHDILFDNLTVKEHLELFSTFKGNRQEEEISKMIKDLGLQEKTNELSKNLSGGQKRRLSVGIAFIGNSKFIVLDEPTSGMDTSARRHIWEMLKNYKNERIILLTTHFMDEADNLGDRIAIMSHGQLKCCGSSVFLKNKFGVGYNLTVSKKEQEQTDAIQTFIKNITPQALRISDVSSEEIYQLPLDCVNTFEKLFNSLDDNLDSLGIESYGISITTLEEVFLSVNDQKQPKNNNQMVNSTQSNPPLKQGQLELVNATDNQGYQEINNFKNIQMGEIDYNFEESYLSPVPRFFNLFKILVWKRIIYFSRDKKGLFMEIIIPILIILLGCALLTVTFIINQPALLLDFNLYPQKQNIIYSGYNDISSTSQQNLMNLLGQTTSQFIPTGVDKPNQIVQWDNYQFSQYNRQQHGSIFLTVMNTNNNQYEYILLANTIAPEAASVYMNQMNQGILRQASQNNQFTLQLKNNPMPLTNLYLQGQATTSGILASMIFTLAIGFIPASVIVFIVKERETKIKHQQLVSGVSLLSYWLSNYVVDYLKYVVFILAFFGLVQAFQVETMVNTSNFQALVLLHFLNGFSMISFLYFFQFLFATYSSAQVVIFIIYNVCGTIFSIAILILRIIDSTREYALISTYILRLFPCFSYGYSLLNNVNVETYAAIERKAIQSVFAWENNGSDMFFMGLTAVFYMVLVFIIEAVQNNKSFNILHKKVSYVPHDKDSDVEAEEALVNKSEPKDFSVLVKQLRKVYNTNGKVAVDQISFGLQSGGVFGLLGVNGAGKTTTFKMLTGDIIPTQGQAYIYGHEISRELHKTRQYIGYCPQFDALLENVTVQEHLQLYAAIKCIPKHKRNMLVNESLYKMDLNLYKNVLSKELSGGNKRKLSVAIAMLGNPPVVFLDEPSTGMDPQARRFMWTVISNISTAQKKSSIILTTHSMEEAEALCTKLGIMVNGELKCLGSIQHIKSKFGKGYELEIKFSANPAEHIAAIIAKLPSTSQKLTFLQAKQILQTLDASHLEQEINQGRSGSHLYFELQNYKTIAIENLIDFILIEQRGNQLQQLLQTQFGEIMVIEHFSNFYRIKVVNKQKVGQLFSFFINSQKSLAIDQYSVKQTSIEQIFNMFAKNEIGFQMKQSQPLVEIENILSSEQNLVSNMAAKQ